MQRHSEWTGQAEEYWCDNRDVPRGINDPFCVPSGSVFDHLDWPVSSGTPLKMENHSQILELYTELRIV